MKTIKLHDYLSEKYTQEEITSLKLKADLMGKYYLSLQKAISKEVKEYAKTNDLSYQKIADEMNTGKSQINKLITGSGNYTLSTVINVALMTGKKPKLTFE
jgi:predicted XRE-type DNA-binding protein